MIWLSFTVYTCIYLYTYSYVFISINTYFNNEKNFRRLRAGEDAWWSSWNHCFNMFLAFFLVILLMEEILHLLRLEVSPIIYKVLYIPGGAGFLPSTVCDTIDEQNPRDSESYPSSCFAITTPRNGEKQKARDDVET